MNRRDFFSRLFLPFAAAASGVRLAGRAAPKVQETIIEGNVTVRGVLQVLGKNGVSVTVNPNAALKDLGIGPTRQLMDPLRVMDLTKGGTP